MSSCKGGFVYFAFVEWGRSGEGHARGVAGVWGWDWSLEQEFLGPELFHLPRTLSLESRSNWMDIRGHIFFLFSVLLVVTEFGSDT